MAHPVGPPFIPESVGDVSASDPVGPEGWWLILGGGGGQAGVQGHISPLRWRLGTGREKQPNIMYGEHGVLLAVSDSSSTFSQITHPIQSSPFHCSDYFTTSDQREA